MVLLAHDEREPASAFYALPGESAGQALVRALMGYCPTPLSQVALIASWLNAESGKPVRLLDPCVGQGEALAALAQALAQQGARVETWGYVPR